MEIDAKLLVGQELRKLEGTGYDSKKHLISVYLKSSLAGLSLSFFSHLGCVSTLPCIVARLNNMFQFCPNPAVVLGLFWNDMRFVA